MTWQQAGIALFGFAIACEWAHIASPMVLAWSHPGLRRIARSRPGQTMLLPALGFAGALLAPFVVVQWVRYAWHLWHFGSQHYGVARLLGWHVNRWVCIVPTAAIMASVFIVHAGLWQWFVLIAIDLQHWLVDLGLSSRASLRRWQFLVAVVAFGVAGLWWKMLQPDYSAILLLTIKARWGMDIVHYLYSRWVWKLSDPLMQAAIGKELLGAKAIRP